jgi:integrase
MVTHRKLGDLPADITLHVLRHSFADLAADFGYNEPTIASLLGHKTHSITSRDKKAIRAVLRDRSTSDNRSRSTSPRRQPAMIIIRGRSGC